MPPLFEEEEEDRKYEDVTSQTNSWNKGGIFKVSVIHIYIIYTDIYKYYEWFGSEVANGNRSQDSCCRSRVFVELINPTGLFFRSVSDL